ncbi:MAG: hypothetical protein KDD61_11490 [Bdellovibrionales bacterium]|nr:hypothetical protein [Bdellovibrionales bacterium]
MMYWIFFLALIIFFKSAWANVKSPGEATKASSDFQSLSEVGVRLNGWKVISQKSMSGNQLQITNIEAQKGPVKIFLNIYSNISYELASTETKIDQVALSALNKAPPHPYKVLRKPNLSCPKDLPHTMVDISLPYNRERAYIGGADRNFLFQRCRSQHFPYWGGFIHFYRPENQSLVKVRLFWPNQKKGLSARKKELEMTMKSLF